jgi:hypothetical protein
VDRVLVRHIRLSGKRGNCGWCESRGIKVVEAHSLYSFFDPVVALFQPLDLSDKAVSENQEQPVGYSLPNCMERKAGWTIFNQRLSKHAKCELLDEIRGVDNVPIGYPEVASSLELWTAPEAFFNHASEEYIWYEFAESIKWKRRFIPEKSAGVLTDPKDWLPQYLDEIAYFTSPTDSYYRARLGGIEEHHTVTKPFSALEMGVPPRTKATAGRANPAGIPYLYVAEKELTAVSEIRPFLGGQVTVARVTPRTSLQVVDLTKVSAVDSPFGHPNLQMALEKHALLSILNRELSKPINPALAEIDYVPTQYLAEVILNSHYDGIRYKSAMHRGGHNVVFFNHKDLQISHSTKLIGVTANKLDYVQIPDDNQA